MIGQEGVKRSFAVLASGTGSNFVSLATQFSDQILGLICNVPDAPVLLRAQARNIPTILLPHKDFPDRISHEVALLQELNKLSLLSQELKKNFSLVVLAGYMRILSPRFFSLFSLQLPHVKIINLHPAHLCDYKGSKGYETAIASRAVRWGISVHEVIPQLDSGEVLAICEFPVYPYLSAAELQSFAQPLEHALLAKEVAKILAYNRKDHDE